MLSNFSFLIDDEIAGCAHPDAYGDCEGAFAELRERGIDALVSVDEEGCPLHVIADNGLQYLHLPVPDFHPPTLQQAEQFIDFAKKQREAGRALAVHCRGGYGRTGTMLACYLVALGGTAEESIRQVRRRRPGSIETEEQEQFVRTVENYLRATDPDLDRRRARRGKPTQ